MKRLVPPLVLAFTLAVILAPFALAADAAKAAAAPVDRSPAAPLAGAISTVTGMAISPLSGTGAHGAYQWASAKDDAARRRCRGMRNGPFSGRRC